VAVGLTASEFQAFVRLYGPKADAEGLTVVARQLDTEYFAARPRRLGESLHLFLLGVAQGFAGHGIAQQLVAESLACGAIKCYRMAVTEATNKTLQHVFRKLGFFEWVRRSYCDHLLEGQAHFVSITDQGGPMLMNREITP